MSSRLCKSHLLSNLSRRKVSRHVCLHIYDPPSSPSISQDHQCRELAKYMRHEDLHDNNTGMPHHAVRLMCMWEEHVQWQKRIHAIPPANAGGVMKEAPLQQNSSSFHFAILFNLTFISLVNDTIILHAMRSVEWFTFARVVSFDLQSLVGNHLSY